ncbi:MAG: hypothetical protein FJ077_14395 [Cyanobacteria bacterium K_DeepCast_35m_m2_023]|nr:hypothetical protein [Cyanobacteria bacterium K_DeepCast_35m_m2_023]
MAWTLQNGIGSHGIMTRQSRHRALCRTGLSLLAVAVSLGWSSVSANDALGTLEPSCPRIASPEGESYIQPMRLKRSQVPAKKKLGCLSPADAVYGADGCPLRFCGAGSAQFSMPAGTPQLPLP